jgi:hypothetical protein
MGGLLICDAAGGREDDGLSLDLDLLSLDGDLLSLAFLSLALELEFVDGDLLSLALDGDLLSLAFLSLALELEFVDGDLLSRALDGDLLSLAFLSLALLSLDPTFCPDVRLFSPSKTCLFCSLPGQARRRGALRGRARAVGGGLGVVYVVWLLCAFCEARPLASGGSEGQRVSRRSRRLRGASFKEAL